ncbi:Radical SAM additional 4Fe4S-binding domain protein [uncultured Desulfobacterium sp.]|uniref:Radical SAM additional 4Fe4S-binding domain protein n=1 Tax=uncultured Desulfobacterium sp. TaxID=201089 RepID=A0A445MS86_9BACT|nr:Radical SAM additional 4Fe4S-binding domain protein [uncultured Desulfobacterium sp.]
MNTLEQNIRQCAGFDFSRQEIEGAVKNGRLLSMEIELSLRCNFNCLYCYVPKDADYDEELSAEEIRHAICQAKELGAKRIIILGGEPTIYPNLLDIIWCIREQGLEAEMFTNGTGITEDLAKRLFDENVRVVLKLNTLDDALQDMLAGKEGASKIIKSAFYNLTHAGYPSKDAFMAASTVICRQNVDELPVIWKWLRDQNIVPYFEMITPQGNARHNDTLNIFPLELKDLFIRLANIDCTDYGINWEPQPPLAGQRCMRHQFSCLITSKGDVMPCVGVTIPVGNIRSQALADIISHSAVLKDLRNYRNTIKGKCRTCEKAGNCYGCRGAAYQLTGDYLASDPLCWENVTT